ncbi:MAG TPA: hypothetical protein VMB51_04165 [Solirubrobacteraceae bacterium]|nr:hypothetical protein [Solirubrobacteraceae bacterium]
MSAARDRLCATGLARTAGLASILVLMLALAGAGTAAAAPLWRLSARAAPSNLAPGSTGLLVVTAIDLGDSGVNGHASPVTLTDMLPAGLVVSGGVAGLRAHRTYPITGEAEEAAYWNCAVPNTSTVSCSTSLDIPAFEGLEIMIPVEVTDPAGTVAAPSNELTVDGGVGAEEHGEPVTAATLTRPVHIGAAPVVFGVEEDDGYVLSPENDGGSVDAQAGSHPFQLTATVNFNQTLETTPVAEGEPPVKGLEPAAPALAKDLSFSLPPGLLGAVAAVEQCPEADFSALGAENVNLCPAGSAVGVADVTINVPKPYGYHQFAVPLFNLVPAPGEPARFGFEIEKVPVELDTAVRTDGDYGVSVSVNEASELGQVLASQVTFWGVPGDPRHDASRGWDCLLGGLYTHNTQPCQTPVPRNETAFLTLPGSCTGQLDTLMQGDSWENETLPNTPGALSDPLGDPIAALEECAALPFNPQIATQAVEPAQASGGAQSTVTAASTPTGLSTTVRLPQTGTLQPQALGEADVREAKVTLPAGMLVSPSAANGLQACTEQQIGYEGPGAPDPLAPGTSEPPRFSSAPATCPRASTIGTVRVKTPLLAEELSGYVYLAAQEQNPFGSLLALYIVAENERLGLRVKLAGEAKADAHTGQLTTVFQNTPQVPFEELQLQLFGGPRASLTTPPLCGQYQTSASFAPWSTGTPFDTSSPPEELNITSGAEGGGCQDPQPFAPRLNAGATSLQAGGYTDFTLQLTRPDGQQALTGLTVNLPPGNAAILKALAPCPEPQASQGACGPESEIGQATAYAGLGPDPYQQTGRVYLTGPYQGAPFGLSIVTPAVAGPFNLGTVVVRSKIEVNPHTAAVTITSGLPTFVQGVGMAPSGIPLQLKRIDVQIDRPDFEYNPTNCNPAQIESTLTGSEGASSNSTVHYQVAGCQHLPFKPGVTATTQGHTSKADGASLALKFTSHPGEAHVAKTILTIPATLPARLTTIQKACIAKVFEANPAACPEGSVIGTATVHTPVLKTPLTGPIYLVSHGNAAWPDAELVLQGEGITVILDGQTAIKKGVTTSSFLSVPDAPFESVEATLPEGPHSALTTNLPLKDHYSLCGQHLTIPTQLGGQNGTAINESVKVAVQGCRTARSRRLTRTKQLARALAACRKRDTRSRTRRASCERAARRGYAGSRRGQKPLTGQRSSSGSPAA